MTSGTSREDVRRLPDCDDARRSGIVYNIGEAETDVLALFGIDGLYGGPSANGIGKGNNDGMLMPMTVPKTIRHQCPISG